MQINGQWCDVTGAKCYDPRKDANEERLRELFKENNERLLEQIIDGIKRGRFTL